MSTASTPRSCAVEGCDIGGYITRGWCYKHYARWLRTGTTDRTGRIVGDDVARFWQKVDKSGDCWEWTASKGDFGYGQFMLDGKSRGAHQVALEWHLGIPRPKGMDTCHHCDNRACVRPSHLYFGTRQQNIDDAWNRNRMPIGSARPAAKITEIDVVAMRKEYAAGADIEDLHSAYGLAISTIRGIVLGYKWKHVGGPITRRRIYKKDQVA